MSTIRDVAKLAQVSTATVSRVINSPDRVSAKTRDRVNQAMNACRYEYNALARGFVTKKSRTIGIIVPAITNPIFAESTRGVQDLANDSDYQVLLGNSYYEYDKEEKLIKIFRERQVEGLVITTTDLKGKILKKLREDSFPFVLLYSTVRKGPVSSVGVDNFLGGYRATEHLIRLNHRRIAILAGDFHSSDRSFHRWHGYKRCLRAHHIPYRSDLIIQTQYKLTSGREGAKSLLCSKSPPTAIFCSNDFLAIGAIEGAREMGLKVPEDLSIVGFDDIEIASFMTPSLSTIRQPAYKMGELGAEILLNQISGNFSRAVHKILETSLVIRDSTAKAPKPPLTETKRRVS